MIDQLSIQFVTDQSGQKQAVLIPFKEWQKLQKEIGEILEYRSMKKSLKTAFSQVKDIKEGKAPKKTLSDFLNES